ncbi:MAG: CD225/dispanin family protein [Sphingobacteriaceae bacterium]|jgi:hypothetical protein|nr:CD225/dispanin family protein [Sphingobacteriaceae bacterium]
MESQNFGQPPAFRPKNWLVESILVTIFCCLPLGIVSIVNAAQVNSRYNAGDYAGAQAASKEAGKWVKIAFFVGIALGVIGIVLNVLIGVGAGLLGSFS